MRFSKFDTVLRFSVKGNTEKAKIYYKSAQDEGYGFSVRGDAPVVVAGVELNSLADVRSCHFITSMMIKDDDEDFKDDEDANDNNDDLFCSCWCLVCAACVLCISSQRAAGVRCFNAGGVCVPPILLTNLKAHTHRPGQPVHMQFSGTHTRAPAPKSTDLGFA